MHDSHEKSIKKLWHPRLHRFLSSTSHQLGHHLLQKLFLYFILLSPKGSSSRRYQAQTAVVERGFWIWDALVNSVTLAAVVPSRWVSLSPIILKAFLLTGTIYRMTKPLRRPYMTKISCILKAELSTLKSGSIFDGQGSRTRVSGELPLSPA